MKDFFCRFIAVLIGIPLFLGLVWFLIWFGFKLQNVIERHISLEASGVVVIVYALVCVSAFIAWIGEQPWPTGSD